MTKYLKIISLTLAAFMFCFPHRIYAAPVCAPAKNCAPEQSAKCSNEESVSVNVTNLELQPGSEVVIHAYGECALIKNSSSASGGVFIPLQTLVAWHDFINSSIKNSAINTVP
jgi:hypothetical protein